MIFPHLSSRLFIHFLYHLICHSLTPSSALISSNFISWFWLCFFFFLIFSKTLLKFSLSSSILLPSLVTYLEHFLWTLLSAKSLISVSLGWFPTPCGSFILFLLEDIPLSPHFVFQIVFQFSFQWIRQSSCLSWSWTSGLVECLQLVVLGVLPPRVALTLQGGWDWSGCVPGAVPGDSNNGAHWCLQSRRGLQQFPVRLAEALGLVNRFP